MKFIKLLIPADGFNIKQSYTDWKLIIDNTEDLIHYKGVDIERYTMEYLSPGSNPLLEKTKFKELVDNVLLKNEVPIAKLGEIIDKKILAMFKAIERGETLMINRAGGYTYLLSALKDWNATILEIIEKPDLGFPVDEDYKFKTYPKTLILENDVEISDTVKEYLTENNITDYGALKILKIIDLSYIVECINHADNIIIDSQFVDGEQVNNFMKIFTTLPQKNVYIFTNNPGTIQNHQLFNENNNKHKIVFLYKI